MMIKGSLAPPLLSIFRQKKLSPVCFGPKFDSFGGINMGLVLNLSFITQMISRLMSYRA